MSKTSDLSRASRTALLDTLAQQLRIVHETKRSRVDPGGLLFEPALQRRLHTKDRSSDLFYDLAKESIDSYQRLLQIGTRHFDSTIERMREAAGIRTVPSKPRLELAASGTIGGEAISGDFDVENPFAMAVDMSFGDVVFTRDGKPLHGAASYVVKGSNDSDGPLRAGQTLRLAPNQKVSVQVVVPLPRSTFCPAKSYVGTAYILCRGQSAGEIQLTVVAAESRS